MALSIKAGENFLVRFNLLKKDGSALVIATDLISAVAEIKQNGKIIETLTYPAANLRVGETSNQLEIEVTQATSDLFTGGDITVKITVVATDAEFDTEEEQKKVYEKLVAKVV